MGKIDKVGVGRFDEVKVGKIDKVREGRIDDVGVDIGGTMGLVMFGSFDTVLNGCSLLVALLDGATAGNIEEVNNMVTLVYILYRRLFVLLRVHRDRVQ